MHWSHEYGPRGHRLHVNGKKSAWCRDTTPAAVREKGKLYVCYTEYYTESVGFPKADTLYCVKLVSDEPAKGLFDEMEE